MVIINNMTIMAMIMINASHPCNGHIGSYGNNGCNTHMNCDGFTSISFSIWVVLARVLAVMNRLAVIAIIAVMAMIAVMAITAVTTALAVMVIIV